MSDALSTIVRQACIDLFADYGIELAPGAAARPLSRCGVIGFSGSDLRGSLMLGCSDELLRAHDTQDWLAELTNQLLGRVKNHLLYHAITIFGSLPIVLGGEQLSPLDVESAGHLFSSAGGIVSVWFDAVMRPGVVLSAELPSADGSGQIYLF